MTQPWPILLNDAEDKLFEVDADGIPVRIGDGETIDPRASDLAALIAEAPVMRATLFNLRNVMRTMHLYPASHSRDLIRGIAANLVRVCANIPKEQK